MACQIDILHISGVGSPLTSVVVTGSVVDCADGIEGSNLEVSLSCRSAADPDARKVLADVHPAGSWVADFRQPLTDCGCGGAVFVGARCLANPSCVATPVAASLPCDDCPRSPFIAADDVNLPTVAVRCDLDGSALVEIGFKFFNDTAAFVQARVNAGPGGTVVTQDAPFVGPGGSAQVLALLRYDPIATPLPAPFVEYVALNGFVLLSCPPVPIPVPQLPACEPSPCAQSVVLQVTDAAGQEVQVSGVNAQLCLLAGSYTLTVVSPAPQPGVIAYSWSEGGTLVNPQPNGPALSVVVADGQTRDMSVTVEKQGCPTPSGSAVLKGCVLDCDVSLLLDLRDEAGAAVALNAGCVPAGNYTAQAVGPVEPPWDFAWTLNGQPQIANTSSVFPFSLATDEAAAITVTATAPGCAGKTSSLSVTACGPPPPPPPPNCGTALLAIIGLLLLGGVSLIAAICLGIFPLAVASAVTVLVGLVFLGLWFFFCRHTTACTTLQTARCLLIYAGLIFLLAAVALSWLTGLACGIPTGLAAVGWFGLASLITDMMALQGCSIKPCLL